MPPPPPKSYKFEVETMLFQTKLIVLGKAMYQNTYWAFERGLNVDLILV